MSKNFAIVVKGNLKAMTQGRFSDFQMDLRQLMRPLALMKVTSREVTDENQEQMFAGEAWELIRSFVPNFEGFLKRGSEA